MFQRQADTQAHHGGFLQTGEGELDFDVCSNRAIDEALEVREELGRGVGERVGLQRAEGDGWDAVQVAPEHRFAQEQHVAAGEEDGFVSIVSGGNIDASDAPVRTVDIDDGLVEDRQRVQIRSSEGGEIAEEIGEFDGFPRKAAADVKGEDGRFSAECVAEEDRAVEAAGNEDGEAGVGIGHAKNPVCRLSI